MPFERNSKEGDYYLCPICGKKILAPFFIYEPYEESLVIAKTLGKALDHIAEHYNTLSQNNHRNGGGTMSVWDERFRRIIEEDPQFLEILYKLQEKAENWDNIWLSERDDYFLFCQSKARRYVELMGLESEWSHDDEKEFEVLKSAKHKLEAIRKIMVENEGDDAQYSAVYRPIMDVLDSSTQTKIKEGK